MGEPGSKRGAEGVSRTDGRDRHLQRLTVSYEYPVIFTRGVFSAQNHALAEIIGRIEADRRHRIFVVVDRGVHECWPDLGDSIARHVDAHRDVMSLTCPVHVVEGGEAAKNDPTAIDRLHRRFFELELDRHAYVVVVGGGAVQDMVGYAAATAHRGLRLIRVPTTVLSQNDSGVGVKNGVNRFGTKNFVGSFAPPFGVIDDFDFLSTLDRRDQLSGMAEAVKVALIRDEMFFHWLVHHADRLSDFEPEPVEVMIRRCAELHMRHIATAGDPFELGNTRPLDFGHWAAHKLETMTGHALRHGEAVSIGLALDTRYSVEIGALAERDLQSTCALLSDLGLPVWHEVLEQRADDGRPEVLDGLDEFRQHLGGDLSITVLEGIGRGFEVHEIDPNAMIAALGWLRGRGHP